MTREKNEDWIALKDRTEETLKENCPKPSFATFSSFASNANYSALKFGAQITTLRFLSCAGLPSLTFLSPFTCDQALSAFYIIRSPS